MFAARMATFRKTKVKYYSYTMLAGCGFYVYQNNSNFSLGDSLLMWLKVSLYCPPSAPLETYNQLSPMIAGQYHINPHRHYKIWFAGDADKFLPDKNQERLVEFRKCNPDDIMTLIYSGQLLSMLAILQMHYFCYLWKIIPLNFDSMTTNNPTENELRLYAIEEMKNHKNGGNLAAASDIVRFLSPTKGLGVYSDFDTKIDSSHAPDKIGISAPFLFHLSLTMHYISFFGCPYFPGLSYNMCNDLLYIADFSSDEVIQIQQTMAERCKIARFNMPQMLAKELHHYLLDDCASDKGATTSENNPMLRTSNQLFYFRNKIEEAMSQGANLKGVYIQTVTKVTGPCVISQWLDKEPQTNSHLRRYSFMGYPQLSDTFRCNEEQDLSWVPGSYMKSA
jgi:hypothetical protein